ncbi:DUF6263 family protein [Thalassoroseus pseudoceratinae]|uniref:DUF6263 family protein n=1 Tax=Thalassoroseus pseudoceratinae TaxID=2713176 RepID=UPI001424A6A6|nr:DUF6263 family protein [Thalassoroseus pseudoceratinae]
MKRLICGGLLTCFLGAMQVVQAADPVQLRYKFTPGEVNTYQTTNKTKQEVSVAGQEISNTVDMTITATRGVERKTEDGLFRVKSTNKRIRVQGDFGPAGKYKFDSEALEPETGSILSDSLNPVFASLGSVEVSFTVSDQGEVRDVSGYEEALAGIVKDGPAAAAFSGGGSNEAFKSSLSDTLPRLPEEAVKVGDSWELPYDLTLKGLGKFKGTRTYTLDEVAEKDGRQIATISMDLELEGTIELKQGPAKVTGTFEVSDSDAKYHFDLESGRIASSELKFTIDGKLNTDINNQTIMTELSQEQTTTTKLMEKAE